MKRSALAGLLFSIALISCHKEDGSSSGKIENEADTIATRYYSATGTLTGKSGEILVSFSKDPEGVLAVLNEKGEVRQAKSVGFQIANFQRWKINSKVYYTYFKTEDNYLLENVATTAIGYHYICDSTLNVIKKVKLVDNGSINTAVQDKLDSHDFILLDTNHYILLTYYIAQPTNIPAELNPVSGARVVDNIIQEIKDDAVVWQWEGTKYPELYTTSIEYNDFSSTTVPSDYMHMNSMYVDPRDNNLICSFRHLNQVLKIDRTTGDIIWRLGGKNSDFALTEDQEFLRQHHAHLLSDNKTLILLDNGEATLRPYSRVVELELDETSKTVTASKTFKIPDAFIQFTGSVVKNGDTYFIGGGSMAYALEINYNTNEVITRLNQTASSYRALKYYDN